MMHLIVRLVVVAVLSAQAIGAQPTPIVDARSTYTVGPSDVLKVTVFNESELTGSFRVDNDGSISYPLLGRLPVQGKTSRQIEEALRKLLLDGYVRNPQVSVEVDQFRSRTIFIIGEVRNAGKYPLQGEMTLLEVLALAGSVTTDASSEILILRPRDGTITGPIGPDDQAEQIRANLDDMKVGRMSANVPLQDGDTIYVPAAERFYVSGHVRNPGSFKLMRGMTVQQAIAVAGGLTDRGSDRRIKIRRVEGDQQKLIDAKLTDMVLPGDTIIIAQRLI
jgi:polysaccharide biosynthesis/export protein